MQKMNDNKSAIMFSFIADLQNSQDLFDSEEIEED